MKYKPKFIDISPKIANLFESKDKLPVAVVGGITEAIIKTISLAFGLTIRVTCGNEKCNETFFYSHARKRPVVCSKCGGEILWSDIHLLKIKICPQCMQTYSVDENFCLFHTPAVKLEEKEVKI